jgi:hypothetical protein
MGYLRTILEPTAGRWFRMGEIIIFSGIAGAFFVSCALVDYLTG